MAQFSARMAPPPFRPSAATRIKQVVKRSPLVRPLLGFSPSRTAEALERLSRGQPEESSPALNQRLQARMMDRLAALSKECRPLAVQ